MNIRARMPITEPMKLYRMPTPSALPASPFSAMGPPSKTVEMEDGVPGIFSKMAEIRPPEMPPMYRPTSRARPLVTSMLKVRGRNRTTAMVADRPGMEPKMMPIMVPNQMSTRQEGVRTFAIACATIILFLLP